MPKFADHIKILPIAESGTGLVIFQKHPLDFVIDLHCSSSLHGIFVQGNSYDSVYRNERHSVFPKMLAQNCPDFILNNTMYNADPDKEGTARRYVKLV